MEEQWSYLLRLIEEMDVSDVHFTLKNQHLKVVLRSHCGLEEIFANAMNVAFFNHLKYVSNLDLGNLANPQSGRFSYQLGRHNYDFRFSYLATQELETGVLRVLNRHNQKSLKALCLNEEWYQSFIEMSKQRSGLIVFCGPTGSGKSTTLHAILHEIAIHKQLQVISLEDPIEIIDDSYIQLQINEKNDFTYESGIKQLMRHDPDVLMIGEVRDSQSAHMLIRSALTGHLVFTTVHAKSCQEVFMRFKEFGISDQELAQTMSGVVSQRLCNSSEDNGRISVYEILQGKDLQYYFKHQKMPKQYCDIFEIIKREKQKGIIVLSS